MATRQKAKSKSKAKRKKNPRHQGGHAPKDHDDQKNQDDQKKAGEEGTGSASITQESQADREGRGQVDARPPAGTGRGSQTDAEAARETRSAGGAYRRCDPLLQPPISRDPAAPVRYVARWRCDPHPRPHHRF
jgi:hypothetical protein